MSDAVQVTDQAVDRILEALRRSEISGRARLPEKPVLHAMVDAALWGGLHREEGRHLSFALAFVSAGECRAEEKIEFGSPLPLDRRSIVRVAPALLQKRSRLGVSVADGDPVLWGITLSSEPCLKVRALAPGRVAIKLGLENIALLEPPDLHIVAGSMHRFVELLAKSITGTERPVLSAMLLMIVDAVRRQGNGGTLLVGPHGRRDWVEGALKQRYLSAETPALALFDELSRREREAQARPGSPFDAALGDAAIRAFLNGERVEESLWRSIAAIGQLSAVDGAVVLNDELRLIDFGAKIRAEEPSECALVEGNSVCRIEIGEVGGMRHRSAAAFAHSGRGLLALVASHDGPLSAFASYGNSDGVFYWPHLERLVD